MKFELKKQHALHMTLLALASGGVLMGLFRDMLYTAQDRNVFVSGCDFLRQMLRSPFGLLEYAGSYLTQYFYYPALGTALLVLLWLGTYAVCVGAFRPSRYGAPLLLATMCCLLASITDVGYWIYTLALPGYWFSQSLGFLVLALLLWAARITPARWRQCWHAASLLLFPVIGWYAYLFSIALLVAFVAAPSGRNGRGAGMLSLAVLPVLAPFVWHWGPYCHLSLRRVMMAGFPYFESNTMEALRPSYPFFVLIALTLCLTWASYRAVSRRQVVWTRRFRLRPLGITVLVLALCAVGMWQTMFLDYNYQSEMRMNRAAMDDDWNAIIQEAGTTTTPSRTMVMLRNIALLNTGNLGGYSFGMQNSGVDIHNPDSMNLNIMQIASPMVYYNYGKVQFAIRWCMETAVGYGFCPYFLKMSARAAQATGEPKLMQRYMHLLGRTTFHGHWRPLPTTPMVKRLQEGFADVIDSDHNDVERYIIENFSLAMGSDDAVVRELNLFYAMIYRDPKYFWPAFHAFASMTKGQNLPLHYQEAYIQFVKEFPVKLPYPVQLDPQVTQRFQSFTQCLENCARLSGQDMERLGEMMQPEWGLTYWWYNYFGRKVY